MFYCAALLSQYQKPQACPQWVSAAGSRDSCCTVSRWSQITVGCLGRSQCVWIIRWASIQPETWNPDESSNSAESRSEIPGFLSNRASCLTWQPAHMSEGTLLSVSSFIIFFSPVQSDTYLGCEIIHILQKNLKLVLFYSNWQDGTAEACKISTKTQKNVLKGSNNIGKSILNITRETHETKEWQRDTNSWAVCGCFVSLSLSVSWVSQALNKNSGHIA